MGNRQKARERGRVSGVRARQWMCSQSAFWQAPHAAAGVGGQLPRIAMNLATEAFVR